MYELKRKILQAKEDKQVLILYHYDDLTLKEISRVLEVSESKIVQLHTKAIQKLRSLL